tara:strand:+ start:113 stop:904 length:792 start_codon:yes stop_codon:yes gene_type:complete
MSNFSALNDSNVELIIEPRKNDTNKIYPGRVIQPTQTTRSVDVHSRSANSIGSYKPIQVSKPLFYQRPSYQQSYYSSCGSSSHCPPKPCPPKPVHGSTGPTGPTGSDGPTGPRGPRGCHGMMGVQGYVGHTGPEGPTGPAGVDVGTPIEIYITDSSDVDLKEVDVPSQSVIMYGDENDLTQAQDITLPHWSIVGNTIVYYLYNEQPTLGGIAMTVLAPSLGAIDPIQMNFQGDTTYQTDSTTLTIPPQGTATIVIMKQNYTVM